ncbi:hypothetical protein B0H17DRAFT_1174310 [Mycena rosella]|uniref:Uncharacterized protein n=1 Tax=Mycena rosella TaxID=1033263 RepID=A0AAD7GYI0_MYCRO|nr:hypothetical protein B0H17DRAFT_1174310 [Mycena rosella]
MSTYLRALRRATRSHELIRPCTYTRDHSTESSTEGAPQKPASTAVAQQTQRKVSTLKPSLITPADYIDISRKTKFSMEFPTSRSRVGIPYASKSVLAISYAGHRPPSSEGVHSLFPDHARGFLYYYSGSHAGPLEGSIRFRLTPDNSPSSFLSGQDLLTPSGFPWQILLAQVACRDNYAFIGDQLIRENLVIPEQLSRCRDVFSQKEQIYPQYTLFGLDSPFLVNFSSPVHLTIVGEQLHEVDMSSLFKNQTRGGKAYFPWTGSGIARLERSTLSEHAGRRVIHLRIIKILQPGTCTVDVRSYDGRVERPEEGQLFMVRFRDGPPKTWAYDIDKKFKLAAVLRVLWDSSPIV